MQEKNEGVSSFLLILRYILAEKNRIKYLSNEVFKSVDIDDTGYIENNELDSIIRSVTEDIRIKYPNDNQYINSIVSELDLDESCRISKEGFVK